MKKYLKKGLFVLLFMMISIIWQAEEGKAEDLVSGDFKYMVNEDTEEETITITGYTGTDSNVVIPEKIDGKKVVKLGSRAFFKNQYLTAVTIPSTVTAIGHVAFTNCKKLTTVSLPSELKMIDYDAFAYCHSLKTVDFPEGMELIGNSAFSNCDSLDAIEIPASVKDIAGSAFGGCSALESISVKEGNTVYDSREDCNAIIQTAENKLFLGCVNTKIPDDITEIAEYAFFCGAAPRHLKIPASVTKMGNNSFFDATGSIESISVEEGNPVYDSRNDCNALIKTADNELYLGCKNTKIPEDVTKIGGSAFIGCKGLTKIQIPAGVTEISNGAFQFCEDLKQAELPEGLLQIGQGAFFGASLEEIKLPISIVEIGNGAFTNNGDDFVIRYAGSACQYQKIVSKMSGADIGTYRVFCATDHVFSDGVLSDTENGKKVTYTCKTCDTCYSFDYVDSEDGVTAGNFDSNTKIALKMKFDPIDGKPVVKIDQNTFNGVISDKQISEIDIPDSVKEIGSYAFRNCYYLTEVQIPESVTKIKDHAFFMCKNLNSITIPAQTTEIGAYAFGYNGHYDESVNNFVEDKIEDFTINCHADTQAVTYAKENGFGAVIEPHKAEKKPEFTWKEDHTAEVVFCCTVCNKEVTDDAEVTSEVTKKPDCITEGVRTYTAVYQDRDSEKTIYTDMKEVPEPIDGHSLVKVEKKAATVTETGHKEYYECSVCHKYFDDAEGREEITDKRSVILPKLEGTSVNPVPTPSDTGNTASQTDTQTDAQMTVTFPQNRISMVVGQKITLKAKVTGTTVASWNSSKKKVAAVTKKGVVTAKKAGTAVITVKTADGKTAVCKVTVKKAPKKITVKPKKLSMKKGQTVKLKYTITKKTYTIVTFKSSNKKVVSVDKNGKLKAKKAGMATITVKTANGKTAKCKVTVQ